MSKPKASLQAAMAQKPQPLAPAEPAPVPAVKLPKADDGKMTTSLRITPDLLSELKVLAVQRRCRVNDVILEAIENHLALNGRRSAA